MSELFKNKRIMIVAAHPDDEVLGPGATMNLLIQQWNVKTHVVILGEGITSRSEKREPANAGPELKRHKENIHQAHTCIGYPSVSIYELPDNRFDSVDLLDIVKIIEKEKQGFLPEVIFTHHGGDLNIDHRRTFEAVITACRPMQDETVKTIISFETPSGTEWRASSDPHHFIPNFFMPVSEEHINAKIKGMESYAFEKRAFPHPRSPEALKILAQSRGISVGYPYAEAFTIIRTIQ